MKLVPFITSDIPDSWSTHDEEIFIKYGSFYDDIIFIPRIHAKLRLIEENFYLCSIRTNNDYYKNFFIIPETNSSFYFLAYFPQIEFVHFLKEAHVDPNELPKNSFYIDFLSSYDYYCNNGYYIGDDEIRKEHVLIKVNSSVQNLFNKYIGIYDPEIITKYETLNTYYSEILKDYNAVIRISSIKEKIAKHNIKNSLIKAGKKILISSLIGIAIDDFIEWGDNDYYNIDTDGCFYDLQMIGDDNVGLYTECIPESHYEETNTDESTTEIIQNDSSNNPSFEGKASNEESYNWYKEKEKHALNEQNSHYEKAKKALERGDQNAYTDHIRRAKGWQTQIDDWGYRAKQIKR